MAARLRLTAAEEQLARGLEEEFHMSPARARELVLIGRGIVVDDNVTGDPCADCDAQPRRSGTWGHYVITGETLPLCPACLGRRFPAA